MISEKSLFKELKFFVFYIFLAFFVSYFMFGVMGKANWVPIFIAFCIFYVFKLSWTIYLPENSSVWKSGEFKKTNIILTYMLSPILIVGAVGMGFASDSFSFGISLALMSVFAGVAMNLRRKGLSNFFESSSDPSFLIWYWLLGMLLCFPVIYPGFFYFVGTTKSWIFLILTLILGFIISTIMLSPDKINQIAPINMTKGNSVYLMLAIGITLIYTSFSIMRLINPHFKIW